MATTTLCPHCHQPYSTERLGIRISPLKARIIDIVKAAGDVGISPRELQRDLQHDFRHERTMLTMRAHRRQINDQLEETDWEIATTWGPNAHWFMRRRKVTK
jgi:hypothetical protein